MNLKELISRGDWAEVAGRATPAVASLIGPVEVIVGTCGTCRSGSLARWAVVISTRSVGSASGLRDRDICSQIRGDSSESGR